MFSVKVILILLAISVLINVVFIFRLFDMAITFDYMQSENKVLKSQKKEIIYIIEKLSKDVTESELKKLAAELSGENLIVKIRDSEIQIGEIIFKYSGEILSVNEFSKIK